MKKIVISVLFMFCMNLQGQDLHYINYQYAPYAFNPGFAGHFNGKTRIHFNTKNQWRAVSDPYQTNGVALDFSKIKKHNIGLSLGILSDQAGTLNYGSNQLHLGAAYQKDIGEKILFSPGIQVLRSNFSLDQQSIQFGNGTETINITQKAAYSVNLGIVTSYYFSKKTILNIGISTFHLNRPKMSLINSTYRYSPRYHIHSDLYLIRGNWHIMPRMIWSKQSNVTEFQIGTELKYELATRVLHSNIRGIFLALDNRFEDAWAYTFGIETKVARIGISNSRNYSNLNSASYGNGGLEMYIRLIFKGKDKPTDPSKGCKLFL